MVEDLSATSVVPALEANMVAFWVAYGRPRGRALRRRRPRPGCHGRLRTPVQRRLSYSLGSRRLRERHSDDARPPRVAAGAHVLVGWPLHPPARFGHAPGAIWTHPCRELAGHGGRPADPTRGAPEHTGCRGGSGRGPRNAAHMGARRRDRHGVPRAVPPRSRHTGGWRGTRAARTLLHPLHRL